MKTLKIPRYLLLNTLLLSLDTAEFKSSSKNKYFVSNMTIYKCYDFFRDVLENKVNTLIVENVNNFLEL
jgi:hypothetical protein